MPQAPRSTPSMPGASPEVLGARSAHSLGVRHVFVYGTLRRGEVNDINRLRPPARYLGFGRLAGALYQLGWYPGLRLAASGEGQGAPVVGEVYEIDPLLEPQLDAIEEIRGEAEDEYRKVLVTVELLADPNAVGPVGASREAGNLGDCAGTSSVRALVYEVQWHRIQGAPRIASGDWLRR